MDFFRILCPCCGKRGVVDDDDEPQVEGLPAEEPVQANRPHILPGGRSAEDLAGSRPSKTKVEALTVPEKALVRYKGVRACSEVDEEFMQKTSRDFQRRKSRSEEVASRKVWDCSQLKKRELDQADSRALVKRDWESKALREVGETALTVRQERADRLLAEMAAAKTRREEEERERKREERLQVRALQEEQERERKREREQAKAEPIVERWSRASEQSTYDKFVTNIRPAPETEKTEEPATRMSGPVAVDREARLLARWNRASEQSTYDKFVAELQPARAERKKNSSEISNWEWAEEEEARGQAGRKKMTAETSTTQSMVVKGKQRTDKVTPNLTALAALEAQQQAREEERRKARAALWNAQHDKEQRAIKEVRRKKTLKFLQSQPCDPPCPVFHALACRRDPTTYHDPNLPACKYDRQSRRLPLEDLWDDLRDLTVPKLFAYQVEICGYMRRWLDHWHKDIDAYDNSTWAQLCYDLEIFGRKEDAVDGLETLLTQHNDFHDQCVLAIRMLNWQEGKSKFIHQTIEKELDAKEDLPRPIDDPNTYPTHKKPVANGRERGRGLNASETSWRHYRPQNHKSLGNISVDHLLDTMSCGCKHCMKCLPDCLMEPKALNLHGQRRG